MEEGWIRKKERGRECGYIKRKRFTETEIKNIQTRRRRVVQKRRRIKG